MGDENKGIGNISEVQKMEMNEEEIVGKLNKHIEFIISDVVAEKIRYEKTHELLKTLKDASMAVVDPATAMIKLAVDNYFAREEMDKSRLLDIVDELVKLEWLITDSMTKMKENHGLQMVELKDEIDGQIVQLVSRIEQLEQEKIPEKLNVKTVVTEIGPIDLSKGRRDPGKTIAKDGEIPIRENVVADLKERSEGKEIHQLIQIMREFCPDQKDDTVRQYLRSHMKYIGMKLGRITAKDFHMAKKQIGTKEQTTVKEPTIVKEKTVIEKQKKLFPSKIKGTKIKGAIARKIGKTYCTTLTEERYLAVLRTVRDNPSILESSLKTATGLSNNAVYTHLLLGVNEKVEDLTVKSGRYTITEQGMKTLKLLEKERGKKRKEMETEQKVQVTEKLKDELVAPLDDDKKIVQTPRKKTAEDEALDKKYAMEAKKVIAKAERDGKEYLLDRDALHIHKTYRIPVDKRIVEALEKLIKDAFNYKISYEQLSDISGFSTSITDAHVRYGIRIKKFAPCGLDDKQRPEVCEYARRNDIKALKNKQEQIIKVQSKSILDGETKEKQSEAGEGDSLWKKIRGKQKDTA
jgi:hypothetical protein